MTSMASTQRWPLTENIGLSCWYKMSTLLDGRTRKRLETVNLAILVHDYIILIMQFEDLRYFACAVISQTLKFHW